MPQQLRQGLMLIAVAAVVFLPRLGATRLWDDDETFFAQVAREMYDRGDLIVPWFNQTLFSHKPPFMYWMMMGAYQVFGVTEFAARLPSAFFGMATVLLVWRLGRILYSPGVGFWAGIVLATSLNFVVISRAATCDAELIFFCTLPIYLFVRATAARLPTADSNGMQLTWGCDLAPIEPTWMNYALIYSAMGVAVMVKGPIGVVLPTSVLGLFLLCRHSRRHTPCAVNCLSGGAENDNGTRSVRTTLDDRPSWRETAGFAAREIAPSRIAETIWRMRPLTAIAAVLLVAGPWFVAVSIKTRGEFLDGFFGVHHFHRFTSAMDNHSGPIWFYLAALCVGFFPWIIFLRPSIIEFRRRIRERNSWRAADVLICSWFVVWVGFFSLASTKFPHYVIPAYPALAFFTACFLDRWTKTPDIYGKWARNAAWGTVAAAGLGILIALPFVADAYLQGERFLGLAGVPLVAGGALCAWLTKRRQIVSALACLTATTIAFTTMVFGMAAVQVDRHQNTFPFAEAIHRRSPAGESRIATFGYFRPGLVYYCNNRIENLADGAAVSAFLAAGSAPAFLVTTEHHYRQMAGALPSRIGIIDRGPWFLKSGQTLLLLGDVSTPPLTAEAPPSAVSETHEKTGSRRK